MRSIPEAENPQPIRGGSWPVDALGGLSTPPEPLAVLRESSKVEVK